MRSRSPQSNCDKSYAGSMLLSCVNMNLGISGLAISPRSGPVEIQDPPLLAMASTFLRIYESICRKSERRATLPEISTNRGNERSPNPSPTVESHAV
jgi:hypothetical protein